MQGVVEFSQNVRQECVQHDCHFLVRFRREDQVLHRSDNRLSYIFGLLVEDVFVEFQHKLFDLGIAEGLVDALHQLMDGVGGFDLLFQSRSVKLDVLDSVEFQIQLNSGNLRSCAFLV